MEVKPTSKEVLDNMLDAEIILSLMRIRVLIARNAMREAEAPVKRRQLRLPFKAPR